LATSSSGRPTGEYAVSATGFPEGTHAASARIIDPTNLLSPASATNAVTFDFTRPTIINSVFLMDFAPHSVRVQFSEDVGGGFAPEKLSVVDADTGATIDPQVLNISYTSIGRAVNLFFPGLPAQVAADGNWRLRAKAGDFSDAAGNGLADDLQYDFFFLTGDTNRDRVVDMVDVDRVVANFGGIGTYGMGDLNYDLFIDLQDMLIVMDRFGATLPPPPAPIRLGAPAPSLLNKGRLDVLN
jgi:hypothetical protein